MSVEEGFVIGASIVLYAHWVSADGGPYTEVVDGVEWTFNVENGSAKIVEALSEPPYKATIPQFTSGVLSVPSSLGGFPVETIGSYAFTSCSNLTILTFPSTVKKVKKRALDYCTGLKQVNFAEGLESLDNSTFRFATNIICVVFAGNAPTVDDVSFREDTPNFTVIAKKTATGWDDDGDGCWMGRRIVFCDFDQYPTLDLSRDLRTETVNGVTWTYTIKNGEATVAEALRVPPYIPTVSQITSGELLVPSSLGGCPVRTIESYAFTGCANLTSITFPSTLKTVEKRALDYCTGLKQVSFSAGLEYLDNATFRFAPNITNVAILGNAPYVDAEKGEGTAVAFRENTSDFTVTAEWGAYGWDGDGDGYWLKHRLVYINRPLCDLALDANGGSCISNGLSVVMDDKIGYMPQATRVGYKFTGWFSSPAGGDVLTTATVITNNMTAYAQWDPICYEVAFCVNGGTGEMANESFAYDQEKALPMCGFTRKGHDFVGWGYGMDSAAMLVDGDVVSNLTTEAGSVVELWAVWKEADPIPDIGDTPSAAEVAAVVADATDSKVSENIDETNYNDFREWAGTVKTVGGDTTGAAGVMASENAWVSFALGQDTLLETPPTDEDLTVEEFVPSTEAGKFDFTVSVEDVEVGSEASKENLKKVFGLEGANTLDPKAFSAEGVDITFGTPENGKVKFTAGPKDTTQSTFFMKVKVK